MALPTIGDGEQLGDGNTNETLNVGRSGQPVAIQPSSSGTLTFFGATAASRPSGATQTTITTTWVTISSGFGFATSADVISIIAAVQAIQSCLKTLGLWKGTA